jgi:hypothetical protein
MLHFMESRVHWRYALVVEHERAYALVQVHHSEGYLSALVRGEDESEMSELMAVLEEEVDTLREWFGVTFTEVAAPCPHCYRERQPQPHHHFSVDALETASANDVPALACPRASAAVIPLCEIAPDIAMSSFSTKIAYADLHLADLLGEGAYADVFRGTFNSETVAVKKLKNTKGFKEFRTEVKFMRFIATHPPLRAWVSLAIMLTNVCLSASHSKWRGAPEHCVAAGRVPEPSVRDHRVHGTGKSAQLSG